MLVTFCKHEWYPVLSPDDDRCYRPSVKEVPDEIWNRYLAAYKEFREALEAVCGAVGEVFTDD